MPWYDDYEWGRHAVATGDATCQECGELLMLDEIAAKDSDGAWCCECWVPGDLEDVDPNDDDDDEG